MVVSSMDTVVAELTMLLTLLAMAQVTGNSGTLGDLAGEKVDTLGLPRERTNARSAPWCLPQLYDEKLFIHS
jgi:hypothetical protein